jgi:hypothetical protein
MNTHHRFYTIQIGWIFLCLAALGAEPKSEETLKPREPEMVELSADQLKADKPIHLHVLLENASHKRLFLSDEAGSVKITWQNPPPNVIVASPGGSSKMGALRRFELVEPADLPLERQGENLKSADYLFEPQKTLPHGAGAIENYQIELTLVGYEVGATTPIDYVVSFPLRVKFPDAKATSGERK